MGSGGAVGVLGTGNAGTQGGIGNTTNNKRYGGDSDVISPQFQNTNGELRGGGKGGRNFNTFGYSSAGQQANINGGFLAGGGAMAVTLDTRAILGGDGGIGGGGGSAVCGSTATEGYLSGGKGGDGLIIVMYTSVG